MVFKKSKIAAYILILMACGLLVVSGCGKKGPPKPPVDNTAPEK